MVLFNLTNKYSLIIFHDLIKKSIIFYRTKGDENFFRFSFSGYAEKWDCESYR